MGGGCGSPLEEVLRPHPPQQLPKRPVGCRRHGPAGRRVVGGAHVAAVARRHPERLAQLVLALFIGIAVSGICNDRFVRIGAVGGLRRDVCAFSGVASTCLLIIFSGLQSRWIRQKVRMRRIRKSKILLNLGFESLRKLNFKQNYDGGVPCKRYV